MKMENFEKSFKLAKIILGWSGIQIFPKKSDRGVKYLIKSWIFYFNLSWLIPAILGELYWLIEGIYTGQSFDELCTCAPCFTICILASVKFNSLYFNRDIVESIIEKLRSIHPIEDEEESYDHNIKARIFKNALEFLNTVLKLFCCWSGLVVIVFANASVLSMAHDYYDTGSTELKVPFRIKYLFEMSTVSRWVLIYIHQVGAMIVASIDLLSTDILFYILCTYLKIHFQLLCIQFENVVSNSKMETNENFRKAVKRHQELIELVEKIELLYSKSTLCNIIMSSLLICLSGFIVTFVHDVSAVSSFLAFLVMNLAQISLLCFFGDMLSSTSTEISQAVYNSLWYDAEPDISKSVLVLIIRARKPCKVTAMKFADLNLNALSAILRTSWSYFALLKTMYD